MKKIIILFAIILAGCSSPPVKVDVPPPNIITEKEYKTIKPAPKLSAAKNSNIIFNTSTAIESNRAEISTSSAPITEVIITKSIMHPDDSFTPSYYSFIYLAKKPSIKDKEHFISICELWRDSFSSSDNVSKYTKPEDNIYFHNISWLLTKQVNEQDCNELLSRYDYARATVIGKQLGIDLKNTQIVTNLNGKVLSMNITRLNKQEDLEQAFNIWRDKVCISNVTSENINPITIKDAIILALGTLGKLVTLK